MAADLTTNRYLKISAWNNETAKYGTGAGTVWFRGTGGSHASAANSFIVDNGNWVIQNGTFGVGTLKPEAKLHVVGTSKFAGDVEIDGARLRSAHGFGILQTNAQDWLRINPDQQYPGIAIYKPVAIGTGGLAVGFWGQPPKGELHVTGNVGVGTTTPGAKLHVVGNSKFAGDVEIDGARLRSAHGFGILQTNANDWLRINPDQQYPGIAIYKPVAIGTGGLAIGSWGQPPKGDLYVSGNVGIGTTTPIARLDVAQVRRTGTHPKTVRGLYVTGNWSDGAGGVEFRHTNGTQGIGFGYNSIYATGTNANQHLNLLPRGTGGVGIGTKKPVAKLDVVGKAQIQDGSGYAPAHNFMASGSLTIGSTRTNYGGGRGWNASTAGLLFETKDNTEIAVHDAGNRVASLMYFEGAAANRITVGRDMGWGAITQTVLHGNVGIGTAEPRQKLVIEGVHNAGRQAGTGMKFGGQIAIKGNAPQIDFIDNEHKDWAIHVNGNKLFFVREPWEYKDLVLDGAGHVGVGTDAPQAKLHVAGQVMITGGAPGAGKVLTSDAKGLASWKKPAAANGGGGGGGSVWTQTGKNIHYDAGNVGIGTSAPATKLHVKGTVRLDGGELQSWGPLVFHPDVDKTGDDVVQFLDSAGNENVRINNDGNVGIGTKTPATKLHIKGGTDASPKGGGYLVIGALNAENLVLDNNEILARKNGAVAPLHMQAEGGDIMAHYHRKTGGFVIKDNDNVGIGTLAPKAKLHIRGGSDATPKDGGYLIIGATNGENLALDTNEILARKNGAVAPLYTQSEGGDFFVHDKKKAPFVVKDDGNVGVGTKAPQAKLHVAGQVMITGGSPGAGKVLTCDANGLASWKAPAAAKGGGGSVWAKAGKNIHYDAGNVGIGTAKPSQQLSVYGGEFVLQTEDNKQDQSILFQNEGGWYTWRLYRKDSGTGDNRADFRIAGGVDPDFNALTDYFTIDKDGNVTIKGTLTAAGFAGDGSRLTGSPVGGDGAAAAAPSGDIVANNVSVAPANDKRGVYFLAALGDFNHAIYNNYSNVDGEGQWDGSKWNCYAGLNVRVGAGKNKKSALYVDGGGNVGLGTEQPKGRLSVTGRGAQGWIAADLGDAEQGDRVVMGTFLGSTKAAIGAHNHALSAWADLLLNPAGGNVGIGTMAPETRLDVVGTGGGAYPVHLKVNGRLHSAHTNGGLWVGPERTRFMGAVDDSIGFYNNKTWQLVVQNNGYVGVGTRKPEARLHVAGQVKITGGAPGAGKVLTSDAKGLASWKALPATGTNGSSVWTKAGKNIHYDAGNVGVGTDKPTQKLSVYDGEFVLQTDDNTQDQSILFQNSAGAYTWRLYRTDAGGHRADFRIAGGLEGDYNALTDYFTIDKNGNVTIKGTLTAAKFAGDGSGLTGSPVGGDGAAAAAAAPSGVWTQTGKNIHYDAGNVGIGTDHPEHPLEMGSGAYCSAGGAWTNAASRAVMENIQDLPTDAALAAVNELNPVQFTYKDAPGETHLGFVAEDVPALVAGDGKGLSPMDFVALLTKAVQEQQKAIAALVAQSNGQAQPSPGAEHQPGTGGLRPSPSRLRPSTGGLRPSTGGYEMETLDWGEGDYADWTWESWDHDWPSFMDFMGRKRRLKRMR